MSQTKGLSECYLLGRPSTPEAHRDVGVTLYLLATVEHELGHMVAACRLLCEAQPIFGALATRLQMEQAMDEAHKIEKLMQEWGCQC